MIEVSFRTIPSDEFVRLCTLMGKPVEAPETMRYGLERPDGREREVIFRRTEWSPETLEARYVGEVHPEELEVLRAQRAALMGEVSREA